MSKQKYPTTSTSTSSDGTTTRRGRADYSHAKADARKGRRRLQAEARQDKYDALSLQDKIKSLVPNGSQRQRARLQAQLASLPPQPKEETATPIVKKTPKKAVKKA